MGSITLTLFLVFQGGLCVCANQITNKWTDLTEAEERSLSEHSRFIDLQQNSAPLPCGTHSLVPGQSVTIQSKNFPNKYPRHHYCKWAFEGTCLQSTISITCTVFRLRRCRRSRLVIWGGGLYARMCRRRERPFTRSSQNNQMNVIFRTRRRRRKGFSCTVTASGMCDIDALNTEISDMSSSVESLETLMQELKTDMEADNSTNCNTSRNAEPSLSSELDATTELLTNIEQHLSDLETNDCSCNSTIIEQDNAQLKIKIEVIVELKKKEEEKKKCFLDKTIEVLEKIVTIGGLLKKIGDLFG